ncbi:hypothetical protein F4818DRAFT_455225 [Hypoxylon cercidicola]|nr:hypothetical protein F4818DRAFT_455225 [Hypoxylon cercidicola]
MEPYQSGATAFNVARPGVLTTISATAWSTYTADYKAGLISVMSRQVPGKRVQVILDTHPDRVILGIVKDILDHSPHLRVEGCQCFGEIMLGLFVDGQSNVGHLNPNMVQTHVMPAIPTMSSISPSSVMTPMHLATPQLVQHGTKRGPPTPLDTLDTRYGGVSSHRARAYGGSDCNSPAPSGRHGVASATLNERSLMVADKSEGHGPPAD